MQNYVGELDSWSEAEESSSQIRDTFRMKLAALEKEGERKVGVSDDARCPCGTDGELWCLRLW